MRHWLVCLIDQGILKSRRTESLVCLGDWSGIGVFRTRRFETVHLCLRQQCGFGLYRAPRLVRAFGISEDLAYITDHARRLDHRDHMPDTAPVGRTTPNRQQRRQSCTQHLLLLLFFLRNQDVIAMREFGYRRRHAAMAPATQVTYLVVIGTGCACNRQRKPPHRHCPHCCYPWGKVFGICNRYRCRCCYCGHHGAS